MRKPSTPTPSPEQRELIVKLGGGAEVARMLKARTGEEVTPQAVWNWAARGIPYRWRAPMALEAGERRFGVPPNFLGEGAVEHSQDLSASS